MSDEQEKLIGKCHVCEINVYDRGKLNKPFSYLGKERMGYPREAALPCGIDRTNDPEVSALARTRCPFETKEEQDAIDVLKGKGIFRSDTFS